MKNNNKGFIKTILAIVGALVLLKYAYDFDIIGLLAEGKFKIVLDKIYEIGLYGWNHFRDILTEGLHYLLDLIKKIFS